MRRRTRARELALQFLYTVEVRGKAVRDELDDFLTASGASRIARRFATDLIDGVLAHQEELDRRITALSQNWSLERMTPIDRNVLRLAGYELLHCKEIPVRVALNEGIELGKRYSTAQSGNFINGLLDALKNERPFADEPRGVPTDHDEEEEDVSAWEKEEGAAAPSGPSGRDAATAPPVDPPPRKNGGPR